MSDMRFGYNEEFGSRTDASLSVPPRYLLERFMDSIDPWESLDTSTGTMTLDRRVEAELFRLNQQGDNLQIPFRYTTLHIHKTWARTFYSLPELYLQPQSIPEIQKIVTLARRCRKRLVVVGNGHSPSDLTCTSSWMINLDNFNKFLEGDVDKKSGLVRFEAGLSLRGLNEELAKRGLTLPNLGSINVQSVAGAIGTGTHGSSLQHGLLSQSITAITLVLSNGQPVRCSATNNTSLFRAALLSLGSLGIIVEITFQAVPDFNISWTQTLVPISQVLSSWPNSLWTTAEYTRVWWLPYLARAVIWRAEHTTSAPRPPESTFYGGKLGYYVYHNLLYLSHYVPRLLPWVEWFVFGMQYGFRPGKYSATAIEPARSGLLMDCLYSQFVNEWALPLSSGPEALTRLGAWINGDTATARIPFNPKGVWVHCPIEVRVSDTNTKSNQSGVRPWLDPTVPDGPTLYLNATLYRPYGLDPPCRDRYYEAFEWLMRDLGGRPHWAKNFAYTAVKEIQEMYGDDLTEFIKVRNLSDPDEMFVGEWHRRNLGLGDGRVADSMAEREVRSQREKFDKSRGGWGDGLLWEGTSAASRSQSWQNNQIDAVFEWEGDVEKRARLETTDRLQSVQSEDSFDQMVPGEASIYTEKVEDDEWHKGSERNFLEEMARDD